MTTDVNVHVSDEVAAKAVELDSCVIVTIQADGPHLGDVTLFLHSATEAAVIRSALAVAGQIFDTREADVLHTPESARVSS